MNKTILLFFVFICLISCRQFTEQRDVKGYGYVPIYAAKNSITNFNYGVARNTENAGKIYAYGNYIFQNEVAIGVHIIDNKNKQNPHKIGFLSIPYNYEIAIKDSFLYANSLTDLVVVDIRNPSNPTIVNKINGVFPAQQFSDKYPNEQNVYFECVDTTKGVVVGWKKQKNITFNCYK